jgi:ABC-type sugar transport system ATPase subunit
VNTFVARFIGSPAMNVLPADTVELGLGGTGRLVGFRPEDVELANGKRADCAECDATVEVVQYLGDEQLAYLKLRDEEIVAKLPAEADLQPGMQRRFAIPHRKLHFFDAETGVAQGTAA